MPPNEWYGFLVYRSYLAFYFHLQNAVDQFKKYVDRKIDETKNKNYVRGVR